MRVATHSAITAFQVARRRRRQRWQRHHGDQRPWRRNHQQRHDCGWERRLRRGWWVRLRGIWNDRDRRCRAKSDDHQFGNDFRQFRHRLHRRHQQPRAAGWLEHQRPSSAAAAPTRSFSAACHRTVSFDLSQLGSQYRNFSQFNKSGIERVDAVEYIGRKMGWTVTAGTVNLTGATATATTIASSGTISVDGTSTLTATTSASPTMPARTIRSAAAPSTTILEQCRDGHQQRDLQREGRDQHRHHHQHRARACGPATSPAMPAVPPGSTNNGTWIGNVIANTGTIEQQPDLDRHDFECRHLQQQCWRYGLGAADQHRRARPPTTASSTAARPSAAVPSPTTI